MLIGIFRQMGQELRPSRSSTSGWCGTCPPFVRVVLGFDAAADSYVAGDPQAFGMTRTPPVPSVSADRPHRRPARPPALGTPMCVYIVGVVELSDATNRRPACDRRQHPSLTDHFHCSVKVTPTV